MYNRFSKVQVPAAVSFFSGKRQKRNKQLLYCWHSIQVVVGTQVQLVADEIVKIRRWQDWKSINGQAYGTSNAEVL